MNLDFKNAVDYHYDQFPPKTLNFEKLIIPLAKATDAIARYDQMLKTMHDNEILLAPLRNQEAVVSSRMEGTVSTMDEILKYEADSNEDKEDTSMARSEVIETILYQRSLLMAQKAIQEGYPLSPSLIKSLHQRLLYFGRGADKTPGEFKKEQNYIADSNRKNILFTPISPEKLNDGLEKLFEFIESSEWPHLIKIAVTHLEFEALHPFKDGNGRVGRMVIALMLWKFKIISAPHFYISRYFEDNKPAYIQGMRKVSEDSNWDDWCIFFLEAIESQAQQNLEIAEKIKALYDEMKIIFSEQLSSKWSVAALDYIFTNPVFRNNKFTSNSGIPGPTAARFTRKLTESGLIRTVEEASGRRSALYSFEPLMELVRV
jgi:Uncharacterized conserved protein